MHHEMTLLFYCSHFPIHSIDTRTRRDDHIRFHRNAPSSFLHRRPPLVLRRAKPVLGLHGVELRLLLLGVQLLEGLVCLVVEDDEVAVADVEAAEVVARVLGVEDVLVHHEGRAARVGRVAAGKKEKAR